MNKEIIRLKGTGDGVKIYMSPDEDFSEIAKALYEKLDEFRKFFGSGQCNIYFIGREVSQSDKIRLESIAKTMLPESSVQYGERTIFGRKKQVKEPEIKESIHEQKIEDAKEFVEARIRMQKEAVATNFKRNRARYFEGDVLEGKEIESDGHLVLMGNVLPGGTVKAAGNVIVIGSLLGKAYAGTIGACEAYIMALNFFAEEIKIADVKKSDCEVFGGQMIAKMTDGEIFIEKFDINM